MEHAFPFAPGFPACLRREAESVILSARFVPHGNEVSAVLQGERVAFPYRIYERPMCGGSSVPGGATGAMLDCLLTRHHDGFVRQEHLGRLLGRTVEPFMLPYILRLAEEYVIEIIRDIVKACERLPKEPLALFMRENPRWLSLMRDRCASYWDCYYKRRFPLKEYPGIILVESLSALLE